LPATRTPFEKLGQTSIGRYLVGKLVPLREKFPAGPSSAADEYRFEQRFVIRNAPGGVSFWPKGWVSLFKWHCVPSFLPNTVMAPKPQSGARAWRPEGTTVPPHPLLHQAKPVGGRTLA